MVTVNIPTDSGFTHILFNLAAQGYSHIKAVYSGYGDSGDVEEIYAIKRGGVNSMEEEYVDTVDDIENYQDEIGRGSDLFHSIANNVTEQLLNNLDNWWDNDGGGGTLWISTDDAQFVCEHYVTIVTYDREDSVATGTFKD